MRFLRLDLLAFGPFTDQSVDLGNEPGLHIIHGPNEAGKSSCLRALRSLLYGISQQTPDNFVHAYQNMRIGGVVSAADGMRLEFIRRKGRTKTLRGPDDVDCFEESQLLRLLGGVDEATFSRQFAIDYEELQRGGASISCGGGELSEVLFAAGAGLADLREIERQLEKEADALFKPRGSNQRIAQSLADLERTRKDIRECQLPTSTWVEHETALRQSEERRREIDEELTHRRTDRNRLDRIGRSLPLISRLKSYRTMQAELANVRLLPEDFSADRRKAETELAHARTDEIKAQREIERLNGELSRVEVPAGVREHRTAITSLHSESGSHRKAAKDRPGLVARRDVAQQQARERLQEFGRPVSLEETKSLRLPGVQRKRIQELAGDCKARIEKQQSTQRTVRELDDEIKRVQETLAQLPAEVDVSDLERTIRQVQKEGDLDARHRTTLTQLTRIAEEAHVELARMPLFDGTLEELETLPVPAAETIDRFENELSEADGGTRHRRKEIERLTDESQSLRRKLDALHLEGEVPTEGDLDSARQRRDAGWGLFEQAWRDGAIGNAPAVAAFIDEIAVGCDLATAFRASIDMADTVADRLRREADRVALNAKLTTDLTQTESRLQKAHEACEEAQGHQDEAQREWRSQWTAAGIDPLPPREMRPWRSRQQEHSQTAAEIRRVKAEVEQLAKQISSHRAELNRWLDTLDQRRAPDEEPLSMVVERCQQTAGKIHQANQHRAQLVREQTSCRERRNDAARQACDAQKILEKWRTDWTDAVAALGLDGDAEPSEANAVIETVDELLKFMDESKDLNGRIAGIDDDAEKFAQSVRHLLRQVAPDLLDTLEASVEQAVADLVDRLNRAEKDQTKIEGWQQQLQQQHATRSSAELAISQWQEELDKMCELAGCQSPDGLPQAEEQSKTRREAELQSHNLEQALLELAAGTALDQWIAAAEQFDSDRVQANLTELDATIQELEQGRKAVSEKVGGHRNELNHMNGSGKAADAQLQAEHLLASIRTDAEEYIRRWLASAVLARAMERFREASQGPVLRRAGELFSTLTRGSFSGLRLDYDGSGKAVLVGARPNGQTVIVSGMSDGTCDQLYLALRIALLESSLEGREPLPFVVDDILVMFDDDRAAAALRALAQLAERTQVIFFTHHDHLVDLAGEALTTSAVRVHRLEVPWAHRTKHGNDMPSTG